MSYGMVMLALDIFFHLRNQAIEQSDQLTITSNIFSFQIKSYVL